MPAACPNCGRGIDRGDQFCDACGVFLGWGAGEPTASQLPPQRGPQPADQSAAVQLQLKSDLIKVAPGNAESTAFTVKNLGTKVEEFRFVVTGPEWIVVEPTALSVYPGQEAIGAVQAAPPRKPSSVAGVAPFRLTVTSALHARVSGSAAGRIEVAPYYELAAELVPTYSSGRGLTRHNITLDNRGNVPLRIMIRPTDVADGLRLRGPAFADVAPGTVTEVPVLVYGSRRWFGRPQPRTFSVIAEAPKPLAATRLSGTRTVIPLFPGWVPAAAAALVVVAAAGGTLMPKLLAHHGSLSPRSTTSASVSPSSHSPSPSLSPSSSPSLSSSPSPTAVASVSPTSGNTAGGATAPPVVTAIAPTSGSTAGGTIVEIQGTGLGDVAAVYFGGVPATITGDSDTEIVVTSPAVNTAGTVSVTVTTPGGTTNTAQFTYM